MKLIQKQKAEEAAKECAFCAIGNRTHFTDESIFNYGAQFAETELTHLFCEFAEWMGKFYTLSKYGEWCSLGMPTTYTTQQLFEIWIKERNNE